MTLRALLVLGHNLGWRTYAATLEESLSEHSDVHVDAIGGGRAAAWMARGGATAPRHREVTRFVRDARRVGPVRRRLEGGDYDVVHAAGHLMARPVLWSGRRQTPLLSVLADGTARQSDRAKQTVSPLGRWSWFDEKRVFRRAGMVSCVSDWAARSVVDDYGVDPARVCVRPYPVADVHQQVRAESEQRRRTASADELVRMVFIGGDFERKGGPWLLDAFARLWSDRATLDIVSNTAPRHSLPPGVRVHVGVKNALVRDRFLPQADMLVHPTRFDQSSLVAIEASAFGLPVVVSDVGGVSEVVDHGVTGLVGTDDSSFIGHVDDLLSSRDRRLDLGAAGRRRFLEVHEATGAADRLVRDWSAAVDSRRAQAASTSS